MASVTFKRGTKAEIEATAKQDGQILMETDQTNNKMYVDLQNNNRVRIGNSNVDDISGITDSLTATSSNIALSAAGGNNLQGQIDTLNSSFMNRNTNLTTLTIGNNTEESSERVKISSYKWIVIVQGSHVSGIDDHLNSVSECWTIPKVAMPMIASVDLGFNASLGNIKFKADRNNLRIWTTVSNSWYAVYGIN